MSFICKRVPCRLFTPSETTTTTAQKMARCFRMLYLHVCSRDVRFPQSQAWARNAAIDSKPSLSCSSKAEARVQSISMIATTYSCRRHEKIRDIPFLLKKKNNASCEKMTGTRVLHTSPLTSNGTTISLRLSPSQAICPGKLSTSATLTVVFCSAAVPQTPLPTLMAWHAGFPWNGPRTSVSLPTDCFDGSEMGMASART